MHYEWFAGFEPTVYIFDICISLRNNFDLYNQVKASTSLPSSILFYKYLGLGIEP